MAINRVSIVTVSALLISAAAACRPAAAQCRARPALPDLRSVVPTHVSGWSVPAAGGRRREFVMFSVGVANTGVGALHMRSDEKASVQVILDEEGGVCQERPVPGFEFHPQHKHWHANNIARYELRRDGPEGPVVRIARKVSFCMIDIYRLQKNVGKITYTRCEKDQGISPGWVDEYDRYVPGQLFEITGMEEGVYVLLVTVNPERSYIETDTGNNTAWTSFFLHRNGAEVELAPRGNSPCDSPGLCGAASPKPRPGQRPPTPEIETFEDKRGGDS